MKEKVNVIKEPRRACLRIINQGGGVMKIEVVPRFRIDGKYYTMDQLPEEQVREIVTEKLDLAMAALKYESKRAAE